MFSETYKNPTHAIFQKPNRVDMLPKLHLTTVRDTIVTCTVCLGNKLNAIKKNPLGVCEITYCFACNGTGLTYISKEGLSHR